MNKDEVEVLKIAVDAGFLRPEEARKVVLSKFGLPEDPKPEVQVAQEEPAQEAVAAEQPAA